MPDIDYFAVSEKVAATITTLERHYGRTFTRPQITFDLKGRVAGQVHRGTIRLNQACLMSDWEDMIGQTIPHEVAHVITRQLYPIAKPHGREWAGIMHILGLPAKVCHNYEVEPSRVVRNKGALYAYHCGCQGHLMTSVTHKRIQSGRAYHCNKCNGILRLV